MQNSCEIARGCYTTLFIFASKNTWNLQAKTMQFAGKNNAICRQKHMQFAICRQEHLQLQAKIPTIAGNVAITARVISAANWSYPQPACFITRGREYFCMQIIENNYMTSACKVSEKYQLYSDKWTFGRFQKNLRAAVGSSRVFCVSACRKDAGKLVHG